MPEGVNASELRERGISQVAIKTLEERGVLGSRKVRDVKGSLARLKKNAINQWVLLNALFEMPEGVSASELRERGISREAIKTLGERGVLGSRKVRVIRDPLASRQYERMEAPSLTEDQQRAWTPIKEALEKSGAGEEGNAFLLRGVTGSGKTELYIRALERTLEMGRRGIVLVPEISLTPQTIQRFSSRFPGTGGRLAPAD